MNESSYSPVPLDMISAWLRGEYLIGQNESVGYELLGWALMLRGLYVYAVEGTPKGTISHWGLCKIDIKDGDMTYRGVRLGVPNGAAMKNKEKGKLQVWYSIFSKLTRVPSSNNPDAYFGYVMFPVEQQTAVNLKLLDQDVAKLLCPNRPTKNNQAKWFEETLKTSSPIEVQEEKDKLIVECNLTQEQRSGMCKYLGSIDAKIGKKLSIDKNDKKFSQAKDVITAVCHIQLEEWKPEGRKGHLQPVLSEEGKIPDNLCNPGTIYFYPLADTAT